MDAVPLTSEDKLWVGAEGRLQSDAFVVGVSLKQESSVDNISSVCKIQYIPSSLCETISRFNSGQTWLENTFLSKFDKKIIVELLTFPCTKIIQLAIHVRHTPVIN